MLVFIKRFVQHFEQYQREGRESLPRRRFFSSAALGAVVLGLAACGGSPAVAPLPSGARILALGDSLTAGVGAKSEESWPSVLARRTGWTIENAGVSGDTSGGALGRLDGLLAQGRYDAILIGIGGNDMLRRMSGTETRDNLRAILAKARAHTPYVALLATPEPSAVRAFTGTLSDAAVYGDVASDEKVLLLKGVYSKVLSDDSLRADRIHANAAGYARIGEAVEEALRKAGWLR